MNQGFSKKRISAQYDYLRQGIVIILYLILFTPLVISDKFFFPYIFTKMLYFRILVEMALLLYIILSLKYPIYRPKINKITASILVFFFILILASFFGVNPYKSFWSTVERGEGLITYFHIVVFFIILSSVMRKKSDWYKYFIVALLAGAAVSLYALGQRLNFSFVLSPGERRLSATIGNSSFLAGYLLINVFIAAITYLMKPRIQAKILSVSAALFFVYIILNTSTRGAVTALLAALVFIIVLYFVNGTSKIIKYIFVSLIALFVVGGYMFWTNRQADWVQNSDLLYRISKTSLNQVSTQSRIATWRSSLESWKDRPVLGYGYENYNVAFNKNFPPQIFRDRGSRVWFDRAHNIIFDIGLTSGVVGLFSYLMIFAAAFYSLWKYFKNNNKNWMLSGIIFTGLSAYFIQNLFVFDTIGTFILFYSLLAFIGYLYSERMGDLSNCLKKFKSVDINPVIVVLLVIVVGFIMYYTNIRLITPNNYLVKASTVAEAGNSRLAMRFIKKALAYNDYQRFEIRHKLGEMIISRNIIVGKDDIFFAIGEFNKSISEDPNDVRNYLFLMDLYNIGGEYDETMLDKTLALSERAIALSPTRQHIYFSRAKAMLGQGRSFEEEGDMERMRKRYDDAIAEFKKAVELNDRNVESHWNVAAAYIFAGKEEDADKYFQWMENNLNFYYNSEKNLKKIIALYVGIGDYEKAALTYEKLIEINSNKAAYYIGLASIYAKMGENDRAIKNAKKAVQIDPSLLTKVQSFINSLKNEKK